MKLGAYLPFQAESDEVTPAALLEEAIGHTQAARDAGFDAIAAGEHFLADYQQLQLVPLLSRLSAEADDMDLVTGVLLLPLRHPIEAAEQLATMNVLAEPGRLIAGIGSGYRDVEFENFGIPKAERSSRLREGIELLNRLWTEENVIYDGDHFSVDEVTINPRPDTKPPIWVGANSKQGAKFAGAHADGFFATNHMAIPELEEQIAAYDEIRERYGNDRTITALRELVVAPTTTEAEEIGRKFVKPKYERYYEWGQYDVMDIEIHPDDPFEKIANNRFIVGTPAEVCAELERYEELGVKELICRCHWPGIPSEQSQRIYNLVGDEVIPYV